MIIATGLILAIRCAGSAEQLITSAKAIATIASNNRIDAVQRTKILAQNTVCAAYGNLNEHFRAKLSQFQVGLKTTITDAVNAAMVLLPGPPSHYTCSQVATADDFADFLAYKHCSLDSGKQSITSSRAALATSAAAHSRAVTEMESSGVRSEASMPTSSNAADTVHQSEMVSLADAGLKWVEKLLTSFKTDAPASSLVAPFFAKLKDVSASTGIYTCAPGYIAGAGDFQKPATHAAHMSRCNAYDSIEHVTAKSVNAVLQLEGYKIMFTRSEGLATALHTLKNPQEGKAEAGSLDAKINKLVEELQSPDLKVLDSKADARLSSLLAAREVIRGAVRKTQRASDIIFKFDGTSSVQPSLGNFGSFIVGSCAPLIYEDNKSFMESFLKCVTK